MGGNNFVCAGIESQLYCEPVSNFFVVEFI